MQQGLAGPGEFAAQRGDRVPFDGRPAREADVQQLADGRPGAVAADEVTPAPPRSVGAAGVGADAVLVLFEVGEPAAGDDLGELLAGQCGAQGAGERVLGEVDRRGGGGAGRVVRGARGEGDAFDQAPAAHDAPGRPAGAGALQGVGAAEPADEGCGVRAEHGGTGGAGLLLAGGLVEDDGGDAEPGEGEGEREADRAGPDHDHRVHGVVPWGRWCVRDMRKLAVGARCVITQRMQPTAAARVK